MEQFCGCKEDCYWYEEWQDMGCHVPYCRCKSADFIEPKDCENCEQYHSKYRPTNADNIRQMSDEELANSLLNIVSNGKCPAGRYEGDYDCASMKRCYDCWLDWLKQEVESDA